MKDCRNCIWCGLYDNVVAVCSKHGYPHRSEADNCKDYYSEAQAEQDYFEQLMKGPIGNHLFGNGE